VDEHVVVVGAGPAGLAAAWAIRLAGLDPLVVDQADSVAAIPRHTSGSGTVVEGSAEVGRRHWRLGRSVTIEQGSIP
jgi:flavin-dependent dehydrogenase